MPPVTPSNYDYGLWGQSASSQRGPFGPFYDSTGRVYLVEALDGDNFSTGLLTCQRANSSPSTELWTRVGGFKSVAPLNATISEHTDAVATSDGIYVITLSAGTFGSTRTYVIYFFDYSIGGWVNIEISNIFTIPYDTWSGISLTTPQITTERNVRIHYLPTNKLFIVYSASFTDGINTNRGIYYSIFNLTTLSYDILNANLISPSAAASTINVICETCLDTVNSKILLIYANTPKDLITGGSPSFSYIGYNYDATVAWSGLLGSNLSFNFNAVGETSYIKIGVSGAYAPFYASVGVFGTAFAHTIGVTRSFFCPFKGNKLHLKILIINTATGVSSQETVFAVDYKVRNSGNPFSVDFNFVPNLAAFSPDGAEVAIVFQEYPSGYLSIVRRLGTASWDAEEKFLELVLNEGLVAVNSYQTNRDQFFGVRQFKYWGLVAAGTINLTIIAADTMNMTDFVQRQLASVSGGPVNPPIDINECPDIVASSACAFVKTINDSEDPLTDCAEEVFSESGAPCHDED